MIFKLLKPVYSYARNVGITVAKQEQKVSEALPSQPLPV